MNAQIKQGARWRYMGPDKEESGIVHTITFVTPHEVATWSDQQKGEHGGYSWLGSIAEFLKHFAPV